MKYQWIEYYHEVHNFSFFVGQEAIEVECVFTFFKDDLSDVNRQKFNFDSKNKFWSWYFGRSNHVEKKHKIISSCSVLHRQVKRTYNIKLEFKYCILIENWTITWILAVLVSFGKVTAIFRFGISFGNKLKKQFRSYLFIQYIYSCTGWMLLPKRYCFISFFMKIFVAMAASIITGTMMTCIYRNNHAG